MLVMNKIDRRGVVQKSYKRIDPTYSYLSLILFSEIMLDIIFIIPDTSHG